MCILRKETLVLTMVFWFSFQFDIYLSFSQKGEFGETFWITLKGKVAILIPKEVEIVNKKGEVRKEKVPTKVATEGAGYAFGELSLLERKPRAATIVCEEDSDFAILDKEHFQQILRKLWVFFICLLKSIIQGDKEEQRLFTEVNFLKSLKIFEQWSYNSIRSLFMYCHVKDITRNQVVYGFGEPSEYMYIIKSGEFKVLTLTSSSLKNDFLEFLMKDLNENFL